MYSEWHKCKHCFTRQVTGCIYDERMGLMTNAFTWPPPVISHDTTANENDPALTHLPRCVFDIPFAWLMSFGDVPLCNAITPWAKIWSGIVMWRHMTSCCDVTWRHDAILSWFLSVHHDTSWSIVKCNEDKKCFNNHQDFSWCIMICNDMKITIQRGSNVSCHTK